jgi:small-conductance mechanosensitive channel
MHTRYFRYNKRIGWLALVFCLVVLLPSGFLYAQENQPPGEGKSGETSPEYNTAYYVVEELNAGLPKPATPVNLNTPQAAVEYFLINARNGDFQSSAYALNLNLVPRHRQAGRAPILAQQFYQVIIQQALIDWDNLPDRPDGQVDQAMGKSDPLVGQPRRSIQVGTIQLDGRDIVIRLQRVKEGDNPPIWVFSSQTVENIPALSQRFGPGILEQYIPVWMRGNRGGGIALWEWGVLVVLVLLTGVVVWVLRLILRYGLERVPNKWLRAMNTAIAMPLALTIGFILLYILIQSLLTLSGLFASIARPALLLASIAALTWLGIRIITFLSNYVAQHYAHRLGSDKEKKQRQMFTYITVARQVLIFVALLLGLGVGLSQFDSLKALGTSLLASAGVLSVIIGIAAQAVLGNIIAGMQIAVTQPVRIGDNVYFEGQWGYVEEITYTYLTIETWDKRRVMVPLKYFITHPTENWSKTNSHRIMPVYVYADYRIDVEAVRQKFDELLRNDEDWDGELEPSVQVTATSEETIEIRALCSASNPIIAWNLHCRMREALVRYVRDLESGQFLPRQRVMLLQGKGGPHDERYDHGVQRDDGLLAHLLDQPPATQNGDRDRDGDGVHTRYGKGTSHQQSDDGEGDG